MSIHRIERSLSSLERGIEYVKAPNEALDSWLFPPNASEPDIYMIAFQEIVELTAGQILQTDPAKKRMWEKFIMDTFAMRKGGKDSDYMLAPHIRNIESATKKVSSDLPFSSPLRFFFFPTPYTRALELTTAHE